MLLKTGNLAHAISSVTDGCPFSVQLWSSIAEHLAQAAPDVMVLVHPLDMRLESSDQKQRIVKGKQTGLSDVFTGVTAHRKHKLYARQTIDSLMNSGIAQAEFSGRVGEECCDDETYSQVSPPISELMRVALCAPDYMCCSI